MVLNNIPQLNLVDETVGSLNRKDDIVEYSVYEEFIYLKSFIEAEVSYEQIVKNLHDKWISFFNGTEEPERKLNCITIDQYFFAILVRKNAHLEHIFSQWTKKLNAFNVKTAESIIQCGYGYELTCIEFYNYLIEEKDYLGKPILPKK